MLPDRLETRRPSRIASRLGARDASSASCVATMIVTPWLVASPASRSITSDTGLRVEVARRLVCEDHAGLDDERAGDGNPLLLATGQVRRQVRGALCEPHLVEERE